MERNPRSWNQTRWFIWNFLLPTNYVHDTCRFTTGSGCGAMQCNVISRSYVWFPVDHRDVSVCICPLILLYYNSIPVCRGPNWYRKKQVKSRLLPTYHRASRPWMSMSLLISVYRFVGCGFQGTGLIKSKMKKIISQMIFYGKTIICCIMKLQKVNLVKSSHDKFK